MTKDSPAVDRIGIALLFAFVGPLVGAAVVVLFILAIGMSNPNGDLTAFFPFVFVAFFVSYPFGFGPALVAGVVYAMLPGALQRLVLAPFYGLISVWAFYGIAGSFAEMREVSNLSTQPMMLATGAAAALGCAWAVRKAGWAPDHGREPAPDHGREPAPAA